MHHTPMPTKTESCLSGIRPPCTASHRLQGYHIFSCVIEFQSCMYILFISTRNLNVNTRQYIHKKTTAPSIFQRPSDNSFHFEMLEGCNLCNNASCATLKPAIDACAYYSNSEMLIWVEIRAKLLASPTSPRTSIRDETGPMQNWLICGETSCNRSICTAVPEWQNPPPLYGETFSHLIYTDLRDEKFWIRLG